MIKALDRNKLRKKVSPTKTVKEHFIRHEVYDVKTNTTFSYYGDEYPYDPEERYNDVFRYECEGNILDSAKTIADKIYAFLTKNNLKDAHLEFISGRWEDSEEMYVIAHVPRTAQEIEDEIDRIIVVTKAKEDAKEARLRAKEEKRVRKELTQLNKLKEKYPNI